MQMRSPEPLNVLKSEYTGKIRCRGLCFELWERSDLFTVLVYLAEIKNHVMQQQHKCLKDALSV